MILLIDNYDSFVHNLARYLRRFGLATRVIRNDEITPTDVQRLNPALVVLSPGPCTPNEAGVSLELVRALWGHIPMLGVCLGHQTIAAALGADVIRADAPRHGQASDVFHDGRFEFNGLPQPFTAARYHSLIVDESTLPDSLQVTSRTTDGIVMSIRHRDAPVFGWQFHPESILTDRGYELLANLLHVVHIPVRGELPTTASERFLPTEREWPRRPVTF